MKKEFVLKISEKAYFQETDRQNTTLSQSQRLMSLQTLLVAAVSLISGMREKTDESFLNYVLFFSIFFILLSLVFNLVAQWGFKHQAFPTPYVFLKIIDEEIEKVHTSYDTETEKDIAISMWDQMIVSLRSVNRKRSIFLLLAITALLVSISLFGFFTFLVIL